MIPGITPAIITRSAAGGDIRLVGVTTTIAGDTLDLTGLSGGLDSVASPGDVVIAAMTMGNNSSARAFEQVTAWNEAVPKMTSSQSLLTDYLGVVLFRVPAGGASSIQWSSYGDAFKRGCAMVLRAVPWSETAPIVVTDTDGGTWPTPPHVSGVTPGDLIVSVGSCTTARMSGPQSNPLIAGSSLFAVGAHNSYKFAGTQDWSGAVTIAVQHATSSDFAPHQMTSDFPHDMPDSCWCGATIGLPRA